jgi:hypothetical protein
MSSIIRRLCPLRQAAARILIAVGLGALLIQLAINYFLVARYAGQALSFPFGLDYGEGIVWQQMINIVAGHGYEPVGVFPAIVYHYTPVYHLTVAAVERLTGWDGLYCGRLVSFLSGQLSALLIVFLSASLVGRSQGIAARVGAGLIGGLLFLACQPVGYWGVLMRVDMIACFFAVAGLAAIIWRPHACWAVLLSAFLSILAIYSKQTSVATPAAVFVGLWLIRPRHALLFLLSCTMLGLAALLWLSWASQGGFIQHIFIYNLNRFAPENFWAVKPLLMKLLWVSVLAYLFSAALLWRLFRTARAAGSFAGWRRQLSGDGPAFAAVVLLAYLGLKTLMLPMILKSGSNSNYLIEWEAGVAIMAGAAFAPFIGKLFKGETRAPWLLGIVAIIALPYAVHRMVDRHIADPLQLVKARTPAELRLIDEVRASRKPVISDEMVLLIRAGRPVLWEPAIFAELGSKGRYDEKSFVAMVRRKDFAFFITEQVRGRDLFDDRYNKDVADALDDAYPNVVNEGGLIVHRPDAD